MKDRPKEEQPQTVQELKRGGEIRSRWSWVEPTVWNERMLEALETGVKGGKWHSLIDKVYRGGNLKAGWQRVRQNRGSGGVDRMTIHEFGKRVDPRLEKLGKELREGTYRPQPIRRTYIPKPGGKEQRPLGIPTVRDRIVQTALRNVIEPIFERKFEPGSYGFRAGRGCHDALRAIEGLLSAGYIHVVDVDIRKYFDSIPHQGLMKEVAEEIADGRVLDLIEGYLEQGILEEMKLWTPEKGTPQGAVISPLLANLYLHPVDVAIREAGYEMVRYADDMVILCRSRSEAEAALEILDQLLQARGLQLHPDKTRIAHLRERPGFQFLGYVFYDQYRDPRESSEKNLREKLRAKTKRNNGTSMQEIIRSVNYTLKGWYGYFKYSSPNSFVWERTDGWLRMRLRAILSKRRKRGRKRRRGRGHDHFRWPNAYFTEQGLFSLVSAPKLRLQPY